MTDVALLHAAIADSRMWEPQVESFSHEHRVIAPDLPGFGSSPFTSNVVDYRTAVRDALDTAGMQRAALVGTSFGGMIALGVTLESPERVSALVLVGAGLDGHDWSQQMIEIDTAEESALERGDLDAAVESQLTWVTGPRRGRDAVAAEVLQLVATMQRNAYELQRRQDVERRDPLDPPASPRLGEIQVRTLSLTGAEDFDDIQQIADRLASGIPGAERATIANAAHLPNLERPEEFDRIVLGFLARHEV